MFVNWSHNRELVLVSKILEHIFNKIVHQINFVIYLETYSINVLKILKVLTLYY